MLTDEEKTLQAVVMVQKEFKAMHGVEGGQQRKHTTNA